MTEVIVGLTSPFKGHYFAKHAIFGFRSGRVNHDVTVHNSLNPKNVSSFQWTLTKRGNQLQK